MSGQVAMMIVLMSLVAACASRRVLSVSRSRAETRSQQFEARRAAGRGVFLGEQEVADAKAATLGTLLQRVPSVRVSCQGAECDVRMSRVIGDCSPAFIVDGHSAPFSTELSMATKDVIGIEIYRSASETPLEFVGVDQSCGTIVIWTRSGP